MFIFNMDTLACHEWMVLIHPIWEILRYTSAHGLMSMIPMWENNPCEDHNTGIIQKIHISLGLQPLLIWVCLKLGYAATPQVHWFIPSADCYKLIVNPQFQTHPLGYCWLHIPFYPHCISSYHHHLCQAAKFNPLFICFIIVLHG
jgi:hypothetical protein